MHMSTSNNNLAQKKEIFSLEKIIITWFSITLIRVFLEIYSSPDPSGYLFSWIDTFIHIPLSFFSIFLSFTLLIYLLTKNAITDVLNFTTKLLLFTLVPPIADLMITGSKASSIGYTIATPDQFINLFFRLMSPFNNPGVTIGMHIAAYSILLTISIFTYKKTKKLLPPLLGIIAGYIILFLYATIPSYIIIPHLSKTILISASSLYSILLKQSWITVTTTANTSEQMLIANDIFLSCILWILVVVQILLLLFFANKKLWLALKNNLRMERILFWFLIATIGIITNKSIFGTINISNTVNVIYLLTFFILITLNIWLAVMINDEEDVSIDTISNPDRPLAKKEIPTIQWGSIKFILFVLIFFGTAIMNMTTAFFLILAQTAYYLYSARPLRLKQHFVFSSVLIGATAIFIAMAGFFLVSPDQHILAFPIKTIFIIGISFALISNFKDIKDFKGDKNENMRTIPVVFGLKKSKLIIAGLFAFSFILVPLSLHLYNLILFSVFCIFFAFYLFTKKHYQERYIFLLLFLHIFTLLISFI